MWVANGLADSRLKPREGPRQSITTFTQLAPALSDPPGRSPIGCGWQWAPTWPALRARPASTPNRTCAATCPRALSAAWIRWPPGVRTWSCASGARRKSASSSPRTVPGNPDPVGGRSGCYGCPPGGIPAFRALAACRGRGGCLGWAQVPAPGCWAVAVRPGSRLRRGGSGRAGAGCAG